MENKKKINSGTKVLIILLVTLILIAGVLVALKFIKDKQNIQVKANVGADVNKEPEKEVIKLPTTFARK